MKGYESRHLEDIAAVRSWRPVRRDLGIRAFGVNAWTGGAGEQLIGAHDEQSSGHEELYLVMEGSAEFTVAGDTFSAPTGTLVVVRDPRLRRSAKAVAPGTTIVTVGAKPGEAYLAPAWEVNAETFPYFDAGEHGQAKTVLERALAEKGEDAGWLYNLACAESQLGQTSVALAHLLRAVALDPQYARFAQEDTDFERIRGDERFPPSPDDA